MLLPSLSVVIGLPFASVAVVVLAGPAVLILGSLHAVGAAPPIDNFCFIDFESVIISGGKAWNIPNRTVDIYGDAASAAYEVVVVVIDPILVAGRRSGWLDAADEVLVDEGTKRVVDGLSGDGADH